jgi:release factor glutamine methyltransferase
VSHASFYGLPLLTAPGRVMTPRAATEDLVETAAERVGDGPARIADVGTGSGAIAVSVALAAPRAEVWATDLSAAAVLLARANARRLGVGDRVHVVRSDLLDRVPGELDLILANLPYLPSADRALYPKLAREPDEAVFASGDGLEPYRRLLDSAGERLASDGAVVIQLHRRVLVAERDELPALSAALSALGRERAGEREPALYPLRELGLSPQVV